jgi:outer membrane protein assembly factor BamB
MKKPNTRAARQRRLPLWKQLAYTVAAATVTGGAIVALGGCGSGGTGSISGGTGSISGGTGGGRLAVTINWPAAPTSRLIPSASQSIKAVVSAGTTVVDTKLLVRPSQPPWTTAVTFTNLQPGSVTLTATAYPNADGTGTAQSTGAVPATIASGQQAAVSLTMATAVKTLQITPQTPAVTVGANVQLTATAYDGSGNVVLITPGNISWAPTSSGNATVSPATGQTTSATGVTTGTQAVTATDSESKVSGSTTVTVTASTGCTSGPVTGPGFLGKSAWPKFGGVSLGNTGKSTGGGATGVLKWTATIGQGGNSQATLGPDGTLYVETYYDNKFWAIDSATGKAKWTYTADTGGNTSPAVSKDGTVYFGSTYYFYALDAATGTMKWKKRADVSNSPTIGLDGTIYACGANGLLAYDPANGNIRWSNYKGAVGYSYVAPPIAADGTLFGVGFTTQGGQLSKLDGKCGTATWNVPLNVNSMALGADGTIYVTADYGRSSTHVVAVNPSNGSIKWSSANVPVQPSPPAIDDARGQLYVLGQTGQLTALDMATGATRWTYQAPTSVPGEGVSNSSPSIGGDGIVYFVACDSLQRTSSLFAMDPVSGQPKWTYKPSGSTRADSTTPTIGPDGTVYFVDRGSGTLYAIK